MIIINQPCLKEKNEKWYITCTVEDNGLQKDIFWGGVTDEYRKYLLYERADAFLVGLLSYAMRSNQDIKCIASVSEELLYNIQQYLIPLVVKYSNSLSNIKIKAKTDSSSLPMGTMVGASASCGVDSFNTIHNQMNSKFKSMNITHLCLNNVGAYNECYGSVNNRDIVKKNRYKKAQELSEMLKVPVIETESNFAEMFEQVHLYTNTYSSMFSVLCMRKAWKCYYYSSAFHDIGLFSLFDNESKDSSYYDLLSLSCFSTDGIKIYSEGGERTRLDKIKSIIDYEPARKFLHVCISGETNCGVCEKCRRTLLCIDIAGGLENFKDVFDIVAYKEKIDDYYEWFFLQYLKEPLENKDMYLELMKRSKFKKINDLFCDICKKIINSDVVIYGFGNRGKKIDSYVRKLNKIDILVVDNDLMGEDVINHNQLIEKVKSRNNVVCLVTPDIYYDEIVEKISKDDVSMFIPQKYFIDALLCVAGRKDYYER